MIKLNETEKQKTNRKIKGLFDNIKFHEWKLKSCESDNADGHISQIVKVKERLMNDFNICVI
jgi:hypothetical protein